MNKKILLLFFLFINVSFLIANERKDIVNPTCGQTITTNTVLTRDITCSTGFTIGANNITLDGNGFTIYMSNNASAINAHNKSGITIKNVNIVYTGTKGVAINATSLVNSK